MNAFVDCGFHHGESTLNFQRSRRFREASWKCFAFEADPVLALAPTLLDTQLLHAAIWNQSGLHPFFRATDPEGSTLLPNKSTGEFSAPFQVPTFNFGTWLLTTFSQADTVIVKMNIEGAEYAVLDSLLADGSVQRITELWVEFHDVKVGYTLDDNNLLLERIRSAGVLAIEARL